MALTKTDLSSIRQVVKDETKPQFEQVGKRFDRMEKKIDKVDKKFDKLFNYLDKDVSHFKRKVAVHLNIPVSELSVSSK